MQQKGRRWARTAKAVAYGPYSDSALEKMRSAGTGPPFYKVGRAVFYDLDEYDAWLASGRRQSTWDHPAPAEDRASVTTPQRSASDSVLEPRHGGGSP